MRMVRRSYGGWSIDDIGREGSGKVWNVSSHRGGQSIGAQHRSSSIHVVPHGVLSKQRQTILHDAFHYLHDSPVPGHIIHFTSTLNRHIPMYTSVRPSHERRKRSHEAFRGRTNRGGRGYD